ncbi:glutathione S-transferase [Lacibacterium aquatile]|uniref:Glutathione S-transferase n=1 Tax=Lacibacterium aquatile TaxID=1168082 RepID=A0ABW5DW79_9PROT
MRTIWGRANSSNVKKVLWAADEADMSFVHVNAGGQFGLVNEPEYRALNPNGLVPCFKDGELVLWESNAIVRYIAAKYAEGTLWQTDPAKRADGDRWMDWTTSTFAPAGAFRDVFWNIVRTPAPQRDMEAVAKGIERCNTLLQIVDDVLAKQPYLSGDSFGMGDIPLGSFIYAWFEMPILRRELPHLAAWYARLQDRPAYRKRITIGLT